MFPWCSRPTYAFRGDFFCFLFLTGGPSWVRDLLLLRFCLPNYYLSGLFFVSDLVIFCLLFSSAVWAAYCDGVRVAVDRAGASVFVSAMLLFHFY